MKTKLPFLISLLFIFFQVQAQTPTNTCSSSPILNINTVYSISNLDISQFDVAYPIDNESYQNGLIRGFYLSVNVPNSSSYKIEIFDVSSNFDPVIGIKTNCTTGYYSDQNSSNIYRNDYDYGGNETFYAGNFDTSNTYNFRIYHYNGNETPTVDFKIKITDNSSSSEADLAVYSIGIDSTNPMVGDQIDLETEITNLGESDVTTPVHIRYTIDGVEIDDDYLNGSDLPLSQFETEFEQESNYVFTNPGTYQYCVIIDNHEQESNFSNNTSCTTITVTDNSCTGITITQQPTNQPITSGNSATFSVSATGTPTITYQWTKDGNNLSGETSSSYTTPILDISDSGNSYMCKVTNCDGTVNSNVATVTVVNCEVTINNVINDNSDTFFNYPRQLWHGYTDETPDVIKVCADGTKSTQIKFVNCTSIPNNYIRVRIIDNLSQDINLIGQITFPDDYQVNYTTNAITIKYQHPSYLTPNSSNERSLNFEIYDYSNPTNTLLSIPVKIFRTPVMMIHGLWGEDNSFNSMDSYLSSNGYPNILKTKVDYFSTNDFSFFENKDVVKDAYNTFILRLRNLKYSVSKVDIIAHSMGGLLSRAYVQSNTYRHNIRKLITLNTPHGGSQWGNLLTDVSIINQYTFIDPLIKLNGIHKSIRNGAIEDLSVDSPAIQQINIPFSTDVYFHSISTDIFAYQDDLWYQILSRISDSTPPYTIFDFYNRLFDNKINDGVVSVPSQKGGLVGSTTSSPTNSCFHTKSRDRLAVKEKVLYLLNRIPNTTDFSNNFRHVNINSFYRQNTSRLSISSTQSNTLHITSPTDQQVFNAGETITINVSSTTNTDKILFSSILQQEDQSILNEASSSNASFQYTIPSNAYGKITFLATSSYNNQYVDYDMISININANSDINMITSNVDTLYVADNYVSPIRIIAHRSNGVSHNIQDVENIQFNISNTNIAEHYYNSLIKGNTVGTTNLTATYNGLSITVPIVVYQGDTTITELPNVLSIIEQIKNNEDLLNIFPNPNNGNFSIRLDTNHNQSIDIKVYNSTGKEVLNLKEKSNNSIYTKEISLKDFSNGIYYIKVTIENKTYVGKIIISK